MNGCLFNEFDHVSGQVDTLDSSLETGRKRSQVVLAEIELLKADKVSEDVLLERLKINVRFLKRKIWTIASKLCMRGHWGNQL